MERKCAIFRVINRGLHCVRSVSFRMDMRVWSQGSDLLRGKVLQPGVGVEPPHIAQAIEMGLEKLHLPGKKWQGSWFAICDLELCCIRRGEGN